jgi:hypothetical protein
MIQTSMSYEEGYTAQVGAFCEWKVCKLSVATYIDNCGSFCFSQGYEFYVFTVCMIQPKLANLVVKQSWFTILFKKERLSLASRLRHLHFLETKNPIILDVKYTNGAHVKFVICETWNTTIVYNVLYSLVDLELKVRTDGWILFGMLCVKLLLILRP